MENYFISFDIPEVEEYLNLRKNCGLTVRGKEPSRIGLNNSIYLVSIRRLEDNKLIGMGRIIGDGGNNFQIVDIAVNPANQGNGLGKKIMQLIVRHIEKRIDPLAYVSLIADHPANILYEQFGFVETAPNSLGMYLKRDAD